MEFLQSLFSRIRNWFAGIWQKTEKRDRTRFLVISGVAVTLLIIAIVMLNSGRYVEVLSSSDALALRSATTLLSENNITPKVSGNSILVDKKDEVNANAVLMQSDISASDIDLSIYERASGLTATEADKRAYAKFQLQADLSRYLKALDFVADANVLINIPDNSRMLPSESQPPSVAVTLYARSGVAISSAQAKNLADYISVATGISTENVVILDQNARKLNLNLDEDSTGLARENYELKKQVETDYDSKVSRLLNPLLGSENFTVAADITLDFDSTTTHSLTFIPVVDELGIPRSAQTTREYARGNNLTAGEPGTDENGLGEDYDEVEDTYYNEYTNEVETINYEISQIDETVIKEKGSIVNKTISVVVNTNDLNQDFKDTTAAIQALVGGAIGLPPALYASNVVVSYFPMQGLALAEEQQAEYDAQVRRERLYELIQIIVLYVIIGICVVMLIWRTFAFIKPKPIEIPAPATDYLVGDVHEYSDLVEAAVQSMELEVTKTPSRERVEEFVDSNPEAVANMLRSWLADEGERSW